MNYLIPLYTYMCMQGDNKITDKEFIGGSNKMELVLGILNPIYYAIKALEQAECKEKYGSYAIT